MHSPPALGLGLEGMAECTVGDILSSLYLFPEDTLSGPMVEDFRRGGTAA